MVLTCCRSHCAVATYVDSASAKCQTFHLRRQANRHTDTQTHTHALTDAFAHIYRQNILYKNIYAHIFKELLK